MLRMRVTQLATALAAVAVLAAGCAAPGPGRGPAKPGGGEPKPQVRDGAHVTIFVPVLSNDELKLARKSVAVKAEKPGPKETLQALMEYSIGGQPLFPEKVRVLDYRVDSDGTATIDFSAEMQVYTGGSMEEAGAINSIVLTAAQFAGVKQVVFLCDGQPMESLGGHADLTVPQIPDRSLLEDGS